MLKINYIEKKQQTATRKEKKIKALKFTLTTEPLESDLNENENFSFFGFQKDISIYIDPVTRLPLQASGAIPTVGKVRLKLREVYVKR